MATYKKVTFAEIYGQLPAEYMTPMVGDTGSGGQQGAAPAPAAGDAAADKFLKADGTWQVPDGSGPGVITSLMGPPGWDGEDGIDGQDGFPGAAGPAGSPGTPGTPGTPGAVGPAGMPGTPGFDGLDGEVGPDGIPGERGLTGQTGTPGTPGAVGPAGMPGTPGFDGLDGEAGLDGMPGTAGATGPAGSPGAPGAPGAAGPAGAPGFPGQDAEEPEFPYIIPGPKGDTGPAGGGGGSATIIEVAVSPTPVTRGKFTITDAAITAVKKVLVWQAPGPYTGKGLLADEAEMAPVTILMTESLSGSAIVRWQAQGYAAIAPDLSGDFGAANTQLNQISGNPQLRRAARRIGKVMGNIKFCYLIFS